MEGYPLTVRTQDGREVRIAAKPQRIVVAGTPLYTEIIGDLGAGNRLVGVSESPDNPPEVAHVPRVGKPLDSNLEQVALLNPDVIFGAIGEEAKKLENVLGIPVVTTGASGGTFSGTRDVFATIRCIGLVVDGHTRNADELVTRIREEMRAVENRVEGLPRPDVAFIYVPRQYAPTVAGTGTPEDEILRLAGGNNLFADIVTYKTVNLEVLLLRDPQVIVTNVDQVEQLLGDSRLEGLRAVKGGRVIGVSSSRLTSSRIAASLRSLAQELHPAAFADG